MSILFLLLALALLSLAHAPRASRNLRPWLRGIAAFGMLLALLLAVRLYGAERGIACFLMATMAAGALTPLALLGLDKLAAWPLWRMQPHAAGSK